jgi:hypothetical protein
MSEVSRSYITHKSLDVSGNLAVTGKATFETFMLIALTDETSLVLTGANIVSFRAPFAMQLTKIPRASLSTGSSSGAVTVDIKKGGTSLLGANKLTIDATQKTSTTAATATTLATATIEDDAEITLDITAAGTGARGLKVVLYYSLM